MSWTFTNDPENVPRDALRSAIGDTNTNDQQLTDEQLAYLLGRHDDNIIEAAIEACAQLAAKYARDAAEAVGDLQQQLFQKSQNYLSLAREYRKQLNDENTEETPRKPGYSLTAIQRTPLFKRGITYPGRPMEE